jgi:hypothetical protein
MNSLKQFNEIILYEPTARIILFYSTSSTNLVLNLHKYNILLTAYSQISKINTVYSLKRVIFH